MIWTLSADGSFTCSVYFSDEHGGWIVEGLDGHVYRTFAYREDAMTYAERHFGEGS